MLKVSEWNTNHWNRIQGFYCRKSGRIHKTTEFVGKIN